MSYLYLTEQGSVLRKSADRFLVEDEDRIVLDLPYHKLEHVLVFGNVQITTQAMGELLDRGIRVSLLNASGRYRGSLSPPGGRNITLRLAQYDMYRSPERCLALARSVVGAKIANSLAVVELYAKRQRPGAELEYAQEVATLPCAMDHAAVAESAEALGGVEGSAARTYYAALMRWNRSGLQWPGRIRRPPRDPVNALLSLTYTLVLQEMGGLLESFGLDVGLGFMHQVEYGRPSLALDLLEAFRAPVCDRLALAALNRGQFPAHSFVDAGDQGVRLTPAALKAYLSLYESWMRARRAKAGGSFRSVLRREVELFSAMLGPRAPEWMPWRFGEDECDT